MTGKARILTSEDEKLRLRLERTHTERFYALMRLIRLSGKMRQAKITYPENK